MSKDLKEFFHDHWLILAPMAGINDPIFRSLCIDYGAMLTYTEMVSSKALSYKNEKTKNLLQLANNEDKVVVQLFGHEPSTIANEAHKIETELGPKLAYIDINMGCPAKKITKKGDGASLLLNKKLASEIVSSCVNACDVAVTVKIRRGFNDEDISLEFASAMQDAGASAVCIHGRSAIQFYKGQANRDCGRNLFKNLDIPVIWSGDVASFKEALELKNEGFAGIMIGRAARGNPFVFSKNATYSLQDKIAAAKKHVIEYAKLYPNNLAYMRKHCNWYVHGLPGATFARNKFSHCGTVNDYINVFDELEKRIGD